MGPYPKFAPTVAEKLVKVIPVQFDAETRQGGSQCDPCCDYPLETRGKHLDYTKMEALCSRIGVTYPHRSHSKQYINVSGAVMEPGRKELPVDRRIDIMDALAMGRGLSPKASKDHIFLRRKGQTIQYSKRQLDQLFEKGERIMLEPDDNIDVKESVF